MTTHALYVLPLLHAFQDDKTMHPVLGLRNLKSSIITTLLLSDHLASEYIYFVRIAPKLCDTFISL
jgi:hypothetical protein